MLDLLKRVVYMRIAILTLPLQTNYGGVIQAFALQIVLRNMQHDVRVISVDNCLRPKKVYWLTRYPRRIIRKYLFHENMPVFHEQLLYGEIAIESRNIKSFIKKYIAQILVHKWSDIKVKEFDAFVVGSDQVWRPIYAVPIENYFLKFLANVCVRRIAYAVSFGTEEWEYTKKQTLECAKLARKFNLITVREDSGVNLCRKYLGVNAVNVLDPTLLLDQKDYISIVEKENIPASSGDLFSYMLDDSDEKQRYVQKIASELGLTPFTIIPKGIHKVYPGVPYWLRSFMDARFIVTDSFHGCVFSIIFNKPFIAIGNKGRGQARFDSLFRVFQLQDRLVDVDDLSISAIYQPIDWVRVNAIRAKLKQASVLLLANSLK